MKIHKLLIVLLSSLVVLGITTQTSYAIQKVTVVPNQTYYPTGTSGIDK